MILSGGKKDCRENKATEADSAKSTGQGGEENGGDKGRALVGKNAMYYSVHQSSWGNIIGR